MHRFNGKDFCVSFLSATLWPCLRNLTIDARSLKLQSKKIKRARTSRCNSWGSKNSSSLSSWHFGGHIRCNHVTSLSTGNAFLGLKKNVQLPGFQECLPDGYSKQCCHSGRASTVEHSQLPIVSRATVAWWVVVQFCNKWIIWKSIIRPCSNNCPTKTFETFIICTYACTNVSQSLFQKIVYSNHTMI